MIAVRVVKRSLLPHLESAPHGRVNPATMHPLNHMGDVRQSCKMSVQPGQESMCMYVCMCQWSYCEKVIMVTRYLY